MIDLIGSIDYGWRIYVNGKPVGPSIKNPITAQRTFDWMMQAIDDIDDAVRSHDGRESDKPGDDG